MIDGIVLNANIYTLNPLQPRASAVAIYGGRIVAVGDDASIRALATAKTAIDDAQGRLLIPGLTDAHVHWEGYTRALRSVDLQDVPSKAEALAHVAARVRETPPQAWVLGRGWAQGLWADDAFPTAADLDAIAPQNPIYLAARSGHAAWVNSLALRMAGLEGNAAIQNPTGGEFVRLTDGSPSGLLLEDPAMNYVGRLIPKLSPDELAIWMLDAQQNALRYGLTGIHDYDNPSCMRALQTLRERGQLQLRFVKQINDPYLEHALGIGLRSGFGDDWLRIGGLKIFADGALGPRTAFMIEPYEGDPKNYGITVTDKEEMYQLVSRASAAGLYSTIHAIGDRAVHDVLDIFEAVRGEESARGVVRRQLRHRIEHVQIVHPDDMGRLAALDVIASMQPIHATSDYEVAERYWGKRSKWAYAWRQQLTAGAVLALGSDAPIEPIEPLKGIHAAVTRQRADGSPSVEGWYPEEKLSMMEALHGFTQGAAFAAYMEDRLGMIAEGYLADMVLFDRDLMTIPSAEILETQVLGTMVNGVWRYRQFD